MTTKQLRYASKCLPWDSTFWIKTGEWCFGCIRVYMMLSEGSIRRRILNYVERISDICVYALLLYVTLNCAQYTPWEMSDLYISYMSDSQLLNYIWTQQSMGTIFSDIKEYQRDPLEDKMGLRIVGGNVKTTGSIWLKVFLGLIFLLKGRVKSVVLKK